VSKLVAERTDSRVRVHHVNAANSTEPRALATGSGNAITTSKVYHSLGFAVRFSV